MMRQRLVLLARSCVIVPLAALGALTLTDHAWTLWNEVQLDAAAQRAEARIAQLDEVDVLAAERIVREELAPLPGKRHKVSAQSHDNGLAVHVDVRVPWSGLFAITPHRSELRRSLALQVDRT